MQHTIEISEEEVKTLIINLLKIKGFNNIDPANINLQYGSDYETPIGYKVVMPEISFK